MLWQAVSGANSVARALNILRSASAEDIEEARTTGTLGLITPVVRAAAAKGRSGEAELLKFLEMALGTHAFDPNTPCPLKTAWEVWSPPIINAAAAGFAQACALLIAHGADPHAVDSDGDTAVHAATEQPHVMALLLLSLIHI